MSRIHTVTSGAGHRLSGAGYSAAARPLQPLAFDGGLALDCQLESGPCRAFNVIYDPRATGAEARVLHGGDLPDAPGTQALFVAQGRLTLEGQGTFGPGEGLIQDGAARGRISEGGAVILVRFTPVRA